jgi:uncharacterized membrane protein YfcA
MTLALIAGFLGLGVAAGVLTTLAGQGGGLLLLLACSALVGPHAALAVTTPALLFGNAHRAVLLRRAIDRRVAVRVVAGALPGALAGGLLAGAMPPVALKVLLALLTAIVIAKALGKLSFGLPVGALAPAGFVVGAMTGTAGGAGVLVAPVLLAAGLSGTAFVGTTATIAVAMHVGRVLAYGATGLFARELALPTLVVAVAITLGNAVAARARARTSLSARATTVLEHVVLAICAVLSVAGLT